MSVQEVETQFVLQVPATLLDDLKRDEVKVAGLGNALAMLFGLPLGAPIRMSLTRADSVQLLEVNGFTENEPSPAEVKAALMGAYAAMFTLKNAQVSMVDLLQEPVTDADGASIDVPTAYPVGTRVRWCGGRTRRESTGLIEAVHQEPGWPAEYDVRVLWKDGRPGVQVQRRHHSELEVQGDQ